jgi:hypothetical protein
LEGRSDGVRSYIDQRFAPEVVAEKWQKLTEKVRADIPTISLIADLDIAQIAAGHAPCFLMK